MIYIYIIYTIIYIIIQKAQCCMNLRKLATNRWGKEGGALRLRTLLLHARGRNDSEKFDALVNASLVEFPDGIAASLHNAITENYENERDNIQSQLQDTNERLEAECNRRIAELHEKFNRLKQEAKEESDKKIRSLRDISMTEHERVRDDQKAREDAMQQTRANAHP